MEKNLNIVGESPGYPKVSLIEPASSVYIHIAAEVDRRLPFFWSSKNKRRLIKNCKSWCEELKKITGVKEATIFKALIIPSYSGSYVMERIDTAHIARFDFAVLIETESAEAAEKVIRNAEFNSMLLSIKAAASYTHFVTTTNVKRIDSVDHQRDGVFLFNYFLAADTDQNVRVWEYTAGWFVQETGLNNSTLLLPRNEAESKYNVINHCRWNKLRDILPALLFKPTFRTFVLENFEANKIAAMPILYRLA